MPVLDLNSHASFVGLQKSSHFSLSIGSLELMFRIFALFDFDNIVLGEFDGARADEHFQFCEFELKNRSL